MDENIITAIEHTLRNRLDTLASEYASSSQVVRACHVDDVLPSDLASRLAAGLPVLHDMLRLRSLGERKYVTAALNRLTPELRALMQAFNDPRVTSLIAKIIGADSLLPDMRFYNGGYTVMSPGDFMRPHLDKSHDQHGHRRRKVVILYYLSPVWREEYGGHLGLWESARRSREVSYRPNRLVIMEQNEDSWHSITPILGPHGRASLTTYLYDPSVQTEGVRLTRFRAWPREPLVDVALDANFRARTLASRLGFAQLRRNPHVYAAARADKP